MNEVKVICRNPIVRRNDDGARIVESNDNFLPFDGINPDYMERYVDVDTGDEYFSADGETFYDARGEKLKNFFKKVGKGLVKGVKAVGRAIKNAARWVATKSKNLVSGAKSGKGKLARAGRRALRQSKRNPSSPQADTFTEVLPPATQSTPADKRVVVGGTTYSTEGVPSNKPIVVATDPTSGAKTIGVEYAANEVVGVQNTDGTYEYYKPTDLVDATTSTKKSKTTTILLITAGVLVVGVVAYFIIKKKK